MPDDPRSSASSGPDHPWLGPLQSLCAAIRGPVRGSLAAVAEGTVARDDVTRAVGEGVGDITFAIDEIAERAVDAWLAETGAVRPLSLLTEDAGWRHVGPSADGSCATLPGFDHGGPRILLDPIDGTRNIMHDLRSAWVVVSLAGPGAGEPRYDALELGIVSELPDTRGRLARELVGVRGAGASVREIELATEQATAARPLRADTDARLDRGYFPFFAFHPALRPHVQAVCADVVRRVAAEHEIDASTVFDDQYISSGGQLALLALGHYRSIVDARGVISDRTGIPTQSAKPYDMAGAALVAQESGCVVVQPNGAALDFPLDATTPVDFAGFHNAATAGLLLPHVAASLGAI